ncbi:MAG: FAD-dependent oxidoreductase [Lachnospiraceae bacterium]|nr:FAD-dependent oxidoreductase [Lachnospiraceae bacterium]
MKHYNLIVIGGGLSGVAAAISAARQGLSVLLAEQSGSLGGAMSNCLIYPFMSNSTRMPGEDSVLPLSAGMFKEFQERYRSILPERSAVQIKSSHMFMTEYYKYMLDEAAAESGVEVLFHAKLFEVKATGEHIDAVRFAVKSGVLEQSADFYIDATGDGDLLAFSGCEFKVGRTEDGLCQPMTTCFRVANVDEELWAEEEAGIQALYKQYQAEGKISDPRENILSFNGPGRGIIHMNTTRVIFHNPVEPLELSAAESKARKQIIELMDLLQNNSKAFANSVLVSVAADIGVRESRKLVGEHVLTAEELMACTRFEDAIAAGNYDIDIHNPAGSGTSHYYFKPGEYYTIPYRSLLPKEYTNLLAAGRCISATHEAQASIRIMPICCCLGEAAGTAVGLASRTGKNTKTIAVPELQTLLKANGAFLG